MHYDSFMTLRLLLYDWTTKYLLFILLSVFLSLSFFFFSSFFGLLGTVTNAGYMYYTFILCYHKSCKFCVYKQWSYISRKICFRSRWMLRQAQIVTVNHASKIFCLVFFHKHRPPLFFKQLLDHKSSFLGILEKLQVSMEKSSTMWSEHNKDLCWFIFSGYARQARCQ